MGADHLLMKEKETAIKVILRQQKIKENLLWCGFSLLVGEGFYTRQETLWYSTPDEAADELRRGIRIFDPDFESDLLKGIDEALASARTAELIEEPL